MTDLPINDVTTFGEPTAVGEALTTLKLLGLAPAPDTSRDRPTVTRVLSADGANLILFSFTPGQCLPDHKAAHPITVQTLSGSVAFTCGDKKETLTPGKIVHLPAYVPHRVDFVSSQETQPAIMLLTMLTGTSGK